MTLWRTFWHTLRDRCRWPRPPEGCDLVEHNLEVNEHAVAIALRLQRFSAAFCTEVLIEAASLLALEERSETAEPCRESVVR